MKKHALRWGLVVSMLLALVTVSAGATGTEPSTPTKPVCPAGHEGWTPVSDTTAITESGNYYLTTDLTAPANASFEVGAPGQTINLCLSGHTVSATSQGKYSLLINGGTVNICDCSEKPGNIVAGSKANNVNAYGLGVAKSAVGNVFDITISGGYGRLGVVFLTAGVATARTQLKLVDVTVSDNHLWGDGWAVLMINSYSDVYLFNTKIQNTTGIGDNGTAINFTGARVEAQSTLWMVGDSEISGNEGASVGGGVRVGGNGAIFNMYNGTISGNTATCGGGVYVDGGTFNMYGGTISTNRAPQGGGVYTTSSATFNMSGGFIKENEVFRNGTAATNTNFYNEALGGGVYANGTFTMSGGTIDGNTSTHHAAGVYAKGGFEMSGTAAITGNINSAGYGAGVYVGGGTFNMEGGSINRNDANSSNGGGVYVGGGTFNMKNGTISANRAGNGGGVYAASTFNMKGGTIGGTNGYAVGDAYDKAKDGNYAKSGGGVYVAASKTFTMSEEDNHESSISGNYVTNNGGGVYTKGTVTVNEGTISNNQYASWGGRDVGVFNTGSMTINGGTVGAGALSNEIELYDASGETVTLTINGGSIGLIREAFAGAGARNVTLNGGIYCNDYSSASFGGASSTTTIAANMKFKPYNSKYLLAAADNGTDMNISESLTVRFHFAKVTGEGIAQPASAVAEIDGTPVNGVAVVTGENEVIVTVPVKATQMAKTIELTVKDANGNVINVDSDSIMGYGQRVLNSDEAEKAAAHTLIIDMLNYGAAAQQYFDVAGAQPTYTACECHTATVVEDPDSYKLSKALYANSRAYHSANLTLNDQVDFNLYFWSGQIEAGSTYSYTIGTKTESGLSFTEYLDEADGKLLYKVTIPNLTVADLRNAEVTVTFTEKNAASATEITDSVYNYLLRTEGMSRTVEGGTDDSGLTRYLMAFATSANQYDGEASEGGNGTKILPIV